MAGFRLLVITTTALLFFAKQTLAGECNSYEREKLNEGYYKCVYKDPVHGGLPTVGVGFNLDKSEARIAIEAVGANYDAVKNGSQCLNDSQIELLFTSDMDDAVSCVSGYVSNNVGPGPRSALADMAFNMGCATLGNFTTLISYVNEEDYSKAVSDMKTTLWCLQVGQRCDRDAACMHLEG